MLRSVWDVIAGVRMMQWVTPGVVSARSAIFLLPAGAEPMRPAGAEKMSAASPPSSGRQ